MNLNLTERLRRDALWIDAEVYPSLLATIAPSCQPVNEPETVLLVPPDSEVPVQALALARHAGDALNPYVDVYAFVPLAFGPVQERAR